MGKNRGLMWAAVTVLAEIVLVVLLVPSSLLDKMTDIEVGWYQSSYSDSTLEVLSDDTNSVHYTLTRETGLADWMRWMFLPEEEISANARGMDRLGMSFWFPYIEGRGEALDDMVWLLILRIVSVGIWMPLLLLLLAPTAVDAIMERRIKQHTFKYPSPFVYRHGLRSTALVGMLMMICLLSPLPVHPYVLPVGIALTILIVGLTVIANMPKRL